MAPDEGKTARDRCAVSLPDGRTILVMPGDPIPAGGKVVEKIPLRTAVDTTTEVRSTDVEPPSTGTTPKRTRKKKA